MNPAFTASQLRSYLPLFRKSSAKVRVILCEFVPYPDDASVIQMCQQWKEDVIGSAGSGTVIRVNQWLARTTLDVLGEGTVQLGHWSYVF